MLASCFALLTSTNISFEGTNDVIQPFPVGLQMVSGDAMRRTPPATGDLQLDPSKGPIQPAQFGCGRQHPNDYPSYPLNSDGSMGGIGAPTNKACEKTRASVIIVKCADLV
jgi:hypothetical protein